MEDDLKKMKKMEDDLKKWKKMEDDLKIRRRKKEDDLNKMEDEPINQNQPNWL
jgi:hypothetical protein